MVIRGHDPSARERAVLDRYASGLKYREIAADLGIAESTVREYLSRIKEKYGMTSRRDLIRLSELLNKHAGGES